MSITAQAIQAALTKLVDPNTHKDYVTSRSAKNIKIDGGSVSLDIVLGYPAKSLQETVRQQIEEALLAVEGVKKVAVTVSSEIAVHSVQQNLKPLGKIKNIIAVASGKGGVGKSTTAVNLALALTAEGAQVGLLDADIYGPSIPQMMGLAGKQPESLDGLSIEPLIAYGVKTMSIGFMVDVDSPMVWRGPMVTQTLEKLLNQTNWGELDYLVIDLPPGTGDTQLTLAQRVPVTGAVIVTTPQDIALIDARKGLKMFEKVGIPILGLIENMSLHICTNCGHEEHIFGQGGAEKMSKDYEVSVLGALPLELSIREMADAGKPTVVGAPASRTAEIYAEIARKIAVKVAGQARDMKSRFPNIVVQNT